MAILIFDLDGVIWCGKKLVHPRIPLVIERLRKNGHTIYFLTNNSTRSQQGYQKKLAEMGIKVRRNEIICTAHATRIYLQEKLKVQKFKDLSKKPVVFVIGEKPLRNEIAKLPVRFASIDDDRKVDYVILGVDLHFNYRKLARATHAILNGADFIATNADKTLPMKNRRMAPGCGSLIAAVSTAINRKPYVVGKPNSFIIRDVLDKFCLSRKDVYIVGDRLDTDIVLANRLGLRSVLVLSGAATQKMARKAKGSQKPEYVIRNVMEIGKVLKHGK